MAATTIVATAVTGTAATRRPLAQITATTAMPAASAIDASWWKLVQGILCVGASHDMSARAAATSRA